MGKKEPPNVERIPTDDHWEDFFQAEPSASACATGTLLAL